MIQCCKDCVPPKRRPGCHDHCDIYQTAKAKHDKEKAEAYKKRKAEYDYMAQKIASVTQYHKEHGLKKNY